MHASEKALSPQLRQAPPSRAEKVAWSFFDFANTAFNTLIVDLVFGTYFLRVICAHRTDATWLFGCALFVCQTLVGVISPLLGALVDVTGKKKRILSFSYAICILSTASLAAMGEGDVWASLIAFMAASVGYAFAENLTASFLPELALPQEIGRLSGLARALGNVGGFLSVVAASPLMSPGFTLANSGAIRLIFLLTAGIYCAAGLPTILFVRERGCAAQRDWKGALEASLLRLSRTFPKLFREARLRLFFGAFLLYATGAAMVMAMAALYGEMQIGLAGNEPVFLLLAIQTGGCAGAILFGFIEDTLGSKRTLQLIVWIWFLGMGGFYFVQDKLAFYAVSAILGMGGGSLHAVSRAVVGILAPKNEHAEYFGLWGLFGRLAAGSGPLVFGLLSQRLHSFHTPMLASFVCFALSLALLSALPALRSADTES
ncbi:MFS transporter [Methylacidimicrobium sp. B4]|uniref:MFS transporter n=1 Tax=Methylacidimicrobium sp. B4 TaxID=2796139 RepID=UPI001A8D6AB3|nr:MFS transporter [Methylacidimicrobium sp. B4]QSR83828.1 MFS transporter [Methylacidimicrobium sp. B4]